MKTILGSRRDQSLARLSIFLIMAALIAGMVGCGPIQYNLTVSSTEGGEVIEPGEATFTYDGGTLVNLVAEADEGYQFVNWTGNVSAIADVNADATTITMNGDYSITANFAIAIEIRDWYDLNAIGNNLSGSYILMNDLDSTTAGYEELASPTANEGSGWQPIGTEEDDLFTGTFDGQGYEIRDLFINRPDEYVGLFSCVEEGGVIKDIGVVNADVTGDYEYVGGLVGGNFAGSVNNCYSTGSVTGRYFVGGLVGCNYEGTVSNSYATGSVTGSWKVGGLVGVNHGNVSNSYATGSVTGSWTVGGLVGQNGKYQHGGTVSNSYATGSVTGESLVGGLMGENTGNVIHSYSTGSVTGSSEVGGLVGWNSYYGTVSNSYSSGNVTGDHYVGGLVGYNDQGSTVSNSYSTGSVTGSSHVGGLVGWNYESTVSNSYSTGHVQGDERIGGLAGLNSGAVTNSFWDIETTGQATSDGGTGKTTEEMQDIATFSGAGWNITAVAMNETDPTYIWNIVDGQAYPLLSWQAV